MGLTVTRGAAPGEVLVRDGDRVFRLFAIAVGEATWVFHDGAVFELSQDRSGQRRHAQSHGSLSSPMPATVVEVKVRAGDTVTAGQTLIVLEAMKMELPVRAPGDGRIERVHCQAGDLVQPDVSLIDFA